MRWWCQRVYGGRTRKMVFLALLLSLLLAVQFISSHVHQVSERGEMRALASTSFPVQEGMQQANTPTATAESKLNPPDMKAKQDGEARDQVLASINKLQTRDIQKVLRLYDSYNNPKTVDKNRMNQALQMLKMGLLEEVSAQIYPDIMDATKNARPLSTMPRPGPLQVIIATTWRSGSTFLEELLASHPGVYNHYEPLIHFGLRQVRGGEEAERAQKLILDLLSCGYAGHDDYLSTARQIRELVARNQLVWKACSNEELGDALCYNDGFLSQACSLYSWSAMKLVRLRLRHLEPALKDEKKNVRIIYLVRDPRGVMNSRSATVAWCNTPDCNDPKFLCSDMKADLLAAKSLMQQFPGRVILLRYEDLALNPVNRTRQLLSNLGLDFDSHMEDFLESHTNRNIDKPWSTSRDSKTRVTYWATKLSKEAGSDTGSMWNHHGEFWLPYSEFYSWSHAG